MILCQAAAAAAMLVPRGIGRASTPVRRLRRDADGKQDTNYTTQHCSAMKYTDYCTHYTNQNGSPKGGHERGTIVLHQPT